MKHTPVEVDETHPKQQRVRAARVAPAVLLIALGVVKVVTSVLPAVLHPVSALQVWADVAFGVVGLELIGAGVVLCAPAVLPRLPSRLTRVAVGLVFGFAAVTALFGAGTVFNAAMAAVLAAALVVAQRTGWPADRHPTPADSQ